MAHTRKKAASTTHNKQHKVVDDQRILVNKAIASKLRSCSDDWKPKLPQGQQVSTERPPLPTPTNPPPSRAKPTPENPTVYYKILRLVKDQAV